MKHLIAIVALLASTTAAAETLYDCTSTEGDAVVMLIDNMLMDDIQRLDAVQVSQGFFVGKDNSGETIEYIQHGNNFIFKQGAIVLEYTCKLHK